MWWLCLLPPHVFHFPVWNINVFSSMLSDCSMLSAAQWWPSLPTFLCGPRVSPDDTWERASTWPHSCHGSTVLGRIYCDCLQLYQLICYFVSKHHVNFYPFCASPATYILVILFLSLPWNPQTDQKMITKQWTKVMSNLSKSRLKSDVGSNRGQVVHVISTPKDSNSTLTRCDGNSTDTQISKKKNTKLRWAGTTSASHCKHLTHVMAATDTCQHMLQQRIS